MSTAMEDAQQAQRPRANTRFSHRSDKSNDLQPTKSRQSKHERKLSESEKRHTQYDLTTKANPNSAMNEAQPIAAALEKPTLQSLRSFQHHDSLGNPIVDPDLSNPTRSRWERPLDTIKSFEAAIDGEYRRRAQSMRVDQTDMMSGVNSRRSSYYGGGYEQNRYSRASYYGRGNGVRDSYAENGENMGGPVGGPPHRMRYGSRMQSDPGWNNRHSQYMGNNVYPMNGMQQSRDTVNTNGSNGSHSDGPYSNEPSSDNSSFDRGMPVQRSHHTPLPEMNEQYGYNGPAQGPNMTGYGAQGPSNGGGYPAGPQTTMPPLPPKHITPPAPIKLGSSAGVTAIETGPPQGVSKKNDDKRRSWFKRRFSKD